MSEVFVDLSRSADRLAGLLKQVGLDPGAAPPRVETLTGGVSSLLLKVTLPSLTVCVKQALPRLRVEKEWCVPTERVFAEVAWLQRVEPLIPGHVPRVLGLDKTLKAFVMEYLPAEQYRNWKTELLAGTVSAPLAAEVGELLGRIHAATAADPDTAIAFDNDASFHALRLEPYLVETARQHPALRDHLQGLIDACGANRRALVHGDISPKNILSGSRGIVLLDAECASFGDPAFDLAFPLSHLLLKALHVGAVRAALTALTCGMLDAYTPYIDWERPEALLQRVAALLPGLLLARVDGKSPVEYLDDSERDTVRRLAGNMLLAGHDSPSALIDDWRRGIELPAS